MISVYTPSHNPRWLGECYRSLAAQTYEDWEWVVVLNKGAKWRHPRDRRVRVMTAEVEGVGEAKARACAECRGELLVELDHDDLLSSDCLEKVAEAVARNPEVSMVYSDTAQITETGERDESRFDERHGWVYYDTKVDQRDVQAFHALEPWPHNVSYIWYEPNHVKAIPTWAYDRAGGYDATRWILDDQDLMCRLYQVGPFFHLPECLYLQRVHEGNTQRQQQVNADIQRGTVQLYERYVIGNALAWSKRNNLWALDLGAAHNKAPGFVGVDQYPGLGVDVVAQLPERLPFADDSVGVIRAMDFLEHVADKVAVMNELYRLLAPGGLLLSMTPSTDGRGAFQDPTHVAWWNENGFWYFTDPNYSRFVPEVRCRFQVSRLATVFPTRWHEDRQISYVIGNLIAVKPGMPRQGGFLHWS